MSNEFEKLDGFMKKHAPPLSELKTLPRPVTNNSWIKWVSAFCLSLVVVVTVFQRQKTYDENTLALTEVLEWDVTSDEMPTELEEVIALAE